MLYTVQEKLINGKWESVAITTCKQSAYGMLEPKGRIIDARTGEQICERLTGHEKMYLLFTKKVL